LSSTSTDEELYGCDNCDGEFPEEDMATLGGDRYIEGFAPTAVPAVCNKCQDEYVAQFAYLRRAR
jgi:hypothetical protein